MLKLLWIATEIPKSEAVRISNTMMWIFAHALLFPFLLLVPGGVDALSWVPPGPVEEVRKYDLCEGQNLSVPWNLTTDPLENIVSIKWTWKSGATSEERELASLLPGDSVNATDSRVGHVGSAGITINNVSAFDTGDIEVKVTLQNQSSQLVVTHVARLLVMVGPDLENEKLTLEVDYTPYQTKTGVSYATLRCGRFRHRGVPTVHPMIETPDGQSVSIAAYNDHEYIYPLDPDSTTVGRYRCQLPAKNLCQDADLRSNVVDVKANDIRLNKLEHLLSQLQQEHDHDKQTLQNTLKQTKQEQDQTKQTLQNTLKQTKQEQDQTKQELEQTKKTLEGVKRDVQRSSFVRWGRTTCPSTTTLVYTGVAGGKPWSQRGGGTNRLCLTRTPQFDNTAKPGHCGNLFGSEYHHIRGHDHHDVPCSVCLAPQSTTIMVPATLTCPPGWSPHYTGHLASERHSHNGGEYVCLDGSPENVPGTGKQDTNSLMFYYTLTVCGSLPCPPYINDKVVTCVVCSK
ncbi:uncharacterized protein [Littorina saxatilis]|uniref:uncharacterized protein n=1 Tax=Littorina saxatilis TaxID=31220 RepID=UPI0038B61278